MGWVRWISGHGPEDLRAQRGFAQDDPSAGGSPRDGGGVMEDPRLAVTPARGAPPRRGAPRRGALPREGGLLDDPPSRLADARRIAAERQGIDTERGVAE